MSMSVSQNRLKTIVLFHAPVICADVIPGVGTLPKTQELHYALLHWRNILFLHFPREKKEWKVNIHMWPL